MNKINSIKHCIVAIVLVLTTQTGFAQGQIVIKTLDSQETVNAFAGTTQFDGHLVIDGANITNLTALGDLTSVTWQFRITDNPNLTSLAGLEGITHVGQLAIQNNDKLINIEGLHNLTRINGSFNVEGNESITSLQGLESLTHINSNLTIHSNARLYTLNGLEGLETVGRIAIGRTGSNIPKPNPLLVDYCAIREKVAQNRNADFFWVVNNGYNPTIAQVRNPQTCRGNVGTFVYQGDIILNSQMQIESFSRSLRDLGVTRVSVTGNLTIEETETGDITNLTSLIGLYSIGGNLEILNNATLESLSGLNTLETLGGELRIGTIDGTDTSLHPNEMLINFCNIRRLVLGTIENPAEIQENKYFVENNKYNPPYTALASGMTETAADMNDGCAEFGTIFLSTEAFLKEDYRLFPNPVNSILYIKSESKITSVSISNLSGQEVLKGKETKINVSHLSKGIYFARITSKEKTIVKKFVKF